MASAQSARARLPRPSHDTEISLRAAAQHLGTDIDLGWLADVDPRGADEDAPGSEVEAFAAALHSTAAECRIEGRLRAEISRWRQITNDATVLSLIEEGLRIPFDDGHDPPPPSHNDRNAIRDDLLKWAEDQIEQMVRAGAVQTWERFRRDARLRRLTLGDKHDVASPIIVAEKPSSTPDNPKYRFILDLRELNKHVSRRRFTCENLHDFTKLLQPGDFLWSADLASAYLHVSVHWRHVQFLGFRFRGRYFVFCVLPFGLSTSAWAFVPVSSVAARAMRRQGPVSALLHYVDNFIGSSGPTRDPARALAAVQLLVDLGFVLNPDKLRIALSQILEGLGHVLNTERMTVTLTPTRRQRILDAIETAWQLRDNVPARVVAKVAGHLLAASMCYGVECKLLSRYLLLFVARVAAAGSYSDRAPLTGRALAELERWRTRARQFGEQPMHRHRLHATVVVDCDASDTAVAGIVVKAPDPTWEGRRIRRELSELERPRSSTLREMRGYGHVTRTLAHHGVLGPGDVLEIVGDSKCADRIFAKGGSQADFDEASGELLLLEALLDILRVASSTGCHVTFRWVRRRSLAAADSLSKYRDRMDFGLAPWALARVFSQLGACAVDRFAAPHNHVCARFNCLFESEGAELGDGFTANWSRDMNYILPEFSQSFIDRVLDKIERDNANAVVIVPMWPSKPFWRRLHSGAWRERIAAKLTLPGSALLPHPLNSDFCFFGRVFDSPIVGFQMQAI